MIQQSPEPGDRNWESGSLDSKLGFVISLIHLLVRLFIEHLQCARSYVDSTLGTGGAGCWGD